MSEPKTIDELADELRRAYFDDPTDDSLLLWENIRPVVQARWRRVAERANEFSRTDLKQ